jgi:hypothetical protein
MLLIYHSILQLYHVLIGHVQVTINLLVEVVVVVVRGVKYSLRAFVIVAIVVIAINTILYRSLLFNSNCVCLFLNLCICKVLTNSSL